MNYRWQITNPPLAEPISLTEAKLHLRVDHTTDDTLITSLITAARQYCESYQSRTYIATKYKLKLDRWQYHIEIPNPPLISIDSITYIDTAGTEQTLSSSYYTVDKIAEPAVVYESYGYSWPAIRGERGDITINFTAGYSAAFTAAATDICTCNGRSFATGDIVRLRNSGGALPAGLAVNTDYYVRDISGSTFKLYTVATGGTAVDITDTGTGTHYIGLVPETSIAAIKLLLGHWYENRETVNIGNITSQLDFTVISLLRQNMVVSL